MLLYWEAVLALLSLMGLGIGGSAYAFFPFIFSGTLDSIADINRLTTLTAIIVLVSTLAYGFAALAICNGRRLGWQIGVGVAIGAVVVPFLAGGFGLVIGSTYVISFLFNIALVVALLHPQSREYQKVWLD